MSTEEQLMIELDDLRAPRDYHGRKVLGISIHSIRHEKPSADLDRIREIRRELSSINRGV